MSDDQKDAPLPSKRTPQRDYIEQFVGFLGNEHHAFAVRKAERLSAAIHAVTGFIGDAEPIRVRLRTLSLTVLQDLIDSQRLGELGPAALAARCVEIASLLSTAEIAGLISAMNAGLIADEYARLATFVRDRYSLIRAQPQVTFADPVRQSPIGFFKGQKDTVSYRTHNKTSEKDTNSTSDSRRKDILSLFLNKDKISIKDAVSVVPNVSEKTIQRELISMVEAGLLIKEGDRRWSTYRKPQ